MRFQQSFIEKAIYIPYLVFLKLLLFSFICGQAAAVAVTFFENGEIKAQLHSNGTLPKSLKVQNFRCFEIFRAPGGTRPTFFKNNIIKILLYSNETLCQISIAFAKELTVI